MEKRSGGEGKEEKEEEEVKEGGVVKKGEGRR